MQKKLVELVAAGEKAAMLQVSAEEQEALALEEEEIATADREQAVELEEEASALLEKSGADAGLAAAEEIEVEELTAQAATEEEESASHAAAGALDEAAVDTETAEATADAAQAARAEAQAHGEEVGVGICEFVPGLDVLCNVIGGITAVGMEGLAASEAVKASTEFAAAVSTKAEEEREVALAAEFQSKAAEDGAAAAQLESEQVGEQELAEEERIAGEQKQAEAEVLIEEAEVAGEEAAGEEATAAEEEEEAESMLANSLVKGVMACWDAMMAALFGIVSFVFFGFKLLMKAAAAISGGHTKTVSGSFLRNASYTVYHSLLFILTGGIFARVFEVFGDLTIQARGGLILGFAFTGACIQGFALCLLPAHLSATHDTWRSLGLHTLRSMIRTSVLYILEVLIVWAAFGGNAFAIPALQELHHCVWWILLSVPLGIHLVFLEIPYLSRTACDQSERQPSLHAENMTETDSLLPIKRLQSEPCQTRGKGWWKQVGEDLSTMQFPFEILVVTCMFGLLIHCIGVSWTLWPTSKALMLSTRPSWLMPLAIIAGGVLLGSALVTMLPWWKRWRLDQH